MIFAAMSYNYFQFKNARAIIYMHLLSIFILQLRKLRTCTYYEKVILQYGCIVPCET